MKIGYIDSYEIAYYKMRELCLKDKFCVYRENEFYLDVSNKFIEVIDLKKLFAAYSVDKNLTTLWIDGGGSELINEDLLRHFPRLNYVFFCNIEIKSLEWITHYSKIKLFGLSSINSFGNRTMIGSFYHPLKHLSSLEYLILSFSNLSDEAIHISNDHSIFDSMKNLKYLNLRETDIEDISFFDLIKSEEIIVNYFDNRVRLDFSKQDNIHLVTLMNLADDSLLDVSHYIGE